MPPAVVLVTGVSRWLGGALAAELAAQYVVTYARPDTLIPPERVRVSAKNPNLIVRADPPGVADEGQPVARRAEPHLLQHRLETLVRILDGLEPAATARIGCEPAGSVREPKPRNV